MSQHLHRYQSQKRYQAVQECVPTPHLNLVSKSLKAHPRFFPGCIARCLACNRTGIGSRRFNRVVNGVTHLQHVFTCMLKCTGVTGPHPGARPGVGARRRAPGGRVFAHGTRPGSARNGDVGPPSSRLTTRRKVHEGPVQCGLGSSRGKWGASDDPIPGPKLWQ
ncbi:hypothetical protein L3Q82_003619 [Scortum barcoo]|uniref:Uncharacterized protein n=1 Tax=Scortum barcoo TaxID=214431 RepID=A0ACB8VN77_9TELE|nr:hypothetical protein L3Q82_003619 [Scortum barcoo]